MPSIIVFPGQGSQFVGMGRRLLSVPKVERMFEMATKVFGFDVLDTCLNGPQSELDKTSKCQAAVFVCSMAAVEHLKQTQPEAVRSCYATAGFSVGEYAALVLADAIKFEDALRVIKVRADAMQKASESVSSGLMTVFTSRESRLGLAMLAARKWCVERLRLGHQGLPVECEVANYLFAECRVIGGNREALDFIEINKDEFKIKRCKRLPVSGAFHTRLMQSAQEDLDKALKTIEIKPPLIQFYSNYDANLCMTPKKIYHNLIKQVSNPVKWEQILNKFYLDKNLKFDDDNPSDKKEDDKEVSCKKPSSQSQDRVYPDIYECGPASQTGPILKVINKKAHKFYQHIET